MIEFKNRARYITALFCAVTFLCFSIAGELAAKEESERKFSRKTGKATLEVMELMNRQDYDLASDKLDGFFLSRSAMRSQ